MVRTACFSSLDFATSVINESILAQPVLLFPFLTPLLDPVSTPRRSHELLLPLSPPLSSWRCTPLFLSGGFVSEELSSRSTDCEPCLWLPSEACVRLHVTVTHFIIGPDQQQKPQQTGLLHMAAACSTALFVWAALSSTC